MNKQKINRRENETIADYKERLYRNRAEYGLNWSDVAKLLNKNEHPDNVRKTSYGYLERVRDEQVSSFDKSIMIVNDLHLPFERDDVLELISKHADEITTLVIAGDLMDCHSISFFPKIESTNLEDELVYTYNFLKKVRKILSNNQEIIIINGNHEERYYRDICDMPQKNMQTLINPNLISMIVDGFTLYKENDGRQVFKGIEGITHIPHWFINIDQKLIVCHPKNFSIVKGKMLENTTQHFTNRDEEFDVVVFGHTHKQSSGIVDRHGGKFAVENGCLCKPMPYGDSGKLNFTPEVYCYTIVKYNQDESVDYNNVKTYHLPDEFDRGKGKRICLEGK